ncbi:nucleotide sugar dehydrogenase [Atlantibacter sp.]|uniref:nucleotide sugar dehydrogenase n=1 Tax=Atlantibacter sp. TaxID=1903473 RepID=UPI0028AA6A51|nr:nucleotide sugar dehydrogenase [Atlantibacter sp.]
MDAIGIIGLGYVGFPLAVEFSKKYKVIGYDIDQYRVSSLNMCYDDTNEISFKDLDIKNLTITTEKSELEKVNFYIVAVPTPVDCNENPDLTFIINATNTIAQNIKKNDIVVYESTVYPGTTEEICIPLLEKVSGLTNGNDFYVGYSPERINPGDKLNSFIFIDKIISCKSNYGLNKIEAVYSQVFKSNLHRTNNIKHAEASKLLENTQRDVNIALMNEVDALFKKDGLDIFEILKLASTKWNFCDFKPGLVGGHCISVDPYYFLKYGINKNVDLPLIKIARLINSEAYYRLFEKIMILIKQKAMSHPSFTILGLAFKENCADIRNSQSIKLANLLCANGYSVKIHDYLVNNRKIPAALLPNFHQEISLLGRSDFLIVTVKHEQFKHITSHEIESLLNDNSIIMDINDTLDKVELLKLNNVTVMRG